MGDVYSVEVLGVIAGQPCASVFHFEAAEETVPNPIEVGAELLAAFHGGIIAGTYVLEYLKCVPENYFLKGLRARRISAGGGPNVSMPADNQQGQRTGNADVSGVGPVGLYHAQDSGDKWVTGKWFVPGVSIDDVEENVFDDALTSQISIFNNLYTDPIGAGPHGPYTQVIWSPTNSVALEIIAETVSLKVGTQRRRYVPL